MGKRILILKSTNYDPVIRESENVKLCSYYTCNISNLFLRVFKRLQLRSTSIFFGKWKKDIKNYDYIILFDNGYNRLVTSYIKRINSKIKIILWFWNPIIQYSEKYLLDKNVDEFWTYSKFDATKYHLNFNSQFFNYDIISKHYLNSKIKSDVFFLGENKGRTALINKLQKIMNSQGISTKIIIVQDKKNYVTYDKYLNNVYNCYALLDIVNDNIDGLTLRCMEALFFNKKLITNNKDIINYDFYNKNNIFVIGIDNTNEINLFLKKPYVKISEKIIENYNFDSWLNRMIK